MQTSNKAMKKLPLYTLLLLLAFACEEKEISRYTIQGNNIMEGTVFLWGADDEHKEISSIRSDSSFTISLTLEDSAIFTLALPDGKIIPLYAKPGITATLQPDTTLKSGWSVNGSESQALHDSISRILDATDDIEQQKKIIEEFVNKHPISEVNVELFRRYLADIPTPDNEHLRKAISRLGGILQDHKYFVITKKLLEKKTGNVKHRMFPTFRYTTIDSSEVTLATYSDKYLLVNIWATWAKESHEQMKRLREIKEKVRSKNFAILNISLDSDTAKWKNAVTNDSIIGDNVIDYKGMNSEVIESFNITSLPYSVLVTPYKRISDYEMKLDSLTAASIDSLTHKHDTKNKQKKKKIKR